MPLTYPGHAVQFGETDADVVTLVQRRLVERGCGPLEITGVVRHEDPRRRAACSRDASRTATGVPLVVDGKIGPLTWESALR